MKYARFHEVEAEPMTAYEFDDFKNREHTTAENAPGYKVTYPDGYVSWCPKDAFEASGRPIDGMTFGMAIEALKRGKKVTRRGWNGKGMFLWLKPATTIKADWCHDPELKALVEQNGGEILALGTVCMYTHDSTGRKAILTGWLASQSDMLCEDWAIVE